MAVEVGRLTIYDMGNAVTRALVHTWKHSLQPEQGKVVRGVTLQSARLHEVRRLPIHRIFSDRILSR